MAVRAVFLDSGGVIAKLEAPRHAIFARAAREAGRPIPDEAARRAFEAAARFEEANEGLLLEDVYAYDRALQEVIFREAGLGAPDPRIQERYEALAQRKEYRSIYPDVVPALEALRRSGLRLGLLSNAHPDLRRLLTHFDLLAYFDAALISGEVGVMKPDRRIFQRGLAALGVEAAEAVHVGDDPVVDYEGARRAGLGALLVDRHGRYAGGGRPTVPDLFSLADALEALDRA